MEKIVINTCVLHPARRVALGEGGVVPRANWDRKGTGGAGPSHHGSWFPSWGQSGKLHEMKAGKSRESCCRPQLPSVV